MQPREICLVDKNKLLVYGLSVSGDRIFELHELQNNSATVVKKLTRLASEQKDYLMHSCDFTGGAWFRSTREEEEHIFYDPA